MRSTTKPDDVTAVALASLTRMVGLLSAELVVGTHRDDIDLIEGCIRAKLHAQVDNVSPAATAQGVALAHCLVEPVLRDLRERAQRIRAAESVLTAEQKETSRTLN